VVVLIPLLPLGARSAYSVEPPAAPVEDECAALQGQLTASETALAMRDPTLQERLDAVDH